MKRNIKQLISEMTLAEKAGMCSGLDFWHLKGVQRLGIPSVMVSDGPHGLRKQDLSADHLGINDSIKAVCFPTACATASSFDRDLIQTMGEAIGEECQAENVSVVLGPAVNIKRSPLCGRNFEYFSEDPYLSSEMAKHHILGVQSKNIGTSIKHFVANNQEYRRMSSSSNMVERTLREIYLASFESAIKEAKPWTVMSSYNCLNGEYVGEDENILTHILRNEWGFDGSVVSDWGAVNDRVNSLKAGLDIEMPASGGETDQQIVAAVEDGTLKEEILDTAVERILNLIFKFEDHRIPETFDHESHHELATRIEEECIVLLKNEKILPLQQHQKVAIIGEFASKPRFQGGGSSHINSFKVTSALEFIKAKADFVYAQGYETKADVTHDHLISEAVYAAKNSDVALLFVGLPDSFESEGYDRTHLHLPNCQTKLIEEVCSVQANTVIVLHNGSPVEMPWIHDVKAIVEVYLGGQGVGEATVNVLYGDVNPSGKLAETFPIHLEDNPSYLNFPGYKDNVDYREGVYVGYRYYDTKKQDVLFPFGHGLSYTTFDYSNLRLSQDSILDTDTLEVYVDVTNTGVVKGKEVVQLYIKDHTVAGVRPEKELKNFVKVELLPSETKTVSMTLSKRSFAWFNEEVKDWYCGSGEYEIMIGSSSRDIRSRAKVLVTSTTKVPFVIHMNTLVGDLLKVEELKPYIQQFFPQDGLPFEGNEAITEEMIMAMVESFPLRSVCAFMGISSQQLQGMIDQLNTVLGNK